jgi:hypothetical protein
MEQQPQQTLPQLNTEELNTIIPKLRNSHDKALAVTSSFTEIPDGDEEAYEEVESLCLRLKKTYDDVSHPLYRKLADRLEPILEEARGLISPFDYKTKTPNEYNRLRGLLSSYKQRELNKKKAVEEAAAKKRERDNQLVDLKTSILKKLNAMVADKIRKAESGSSDYFSATTLETFDSRAESYMKWKPKLSPEDYEACFQEPIRSINNGAQLDSDFPAWIAKLQEAEPFDKYNDLVMAGATPIINEWRAKIPDLKQELIELSKVASDKEASEKLALEQKRKAQQEAARRQAEIDENAKKASQELDTQAGLDKMSNAFAEQATVQQAGDVGSVKYVLKFNDPKKTPQALATIIYHCMAHPDFPGIQKKTKDKKPAIDDEGRPEYVDAVQWWINFFMTKCDASIDGTDVFEKAKIIIRK